ncbi:hypothetical protein KI387_010816 [Taxus chinensis]|uniref:Uncharacterized protein n=1 Tax=Taxus chinensis TaxID=29808 RepID=A0AA38KWR5_TAXCH|nr:hypothetical protein KI387_010816 [Taxus chinensis]
MCHQCDADVTSPKIEPLVVLSWSSSVGTMSRLQGPLLASSCTQTSEPKAYPPNMWGEDFICSLVTKHQLDDSEEFRMEMLISEIKDIFHSMEDGEISPSAYDTAWVARVPAIAIDGSHDHPLFPQTLKWICSNQLADGSWGESTVFLASDRILHTLSCLISLTIWNTGKIHVQKGLDFMRRHAQEMVKEVLADKTSKVFEMVFPTMLKEAKSLGLDVDLSFFKRINEKRDVHLKKNWDERGIGFGRESLLPDINITATALRLLRLHGYNVSSDVLKNIKTEDEEFIELCDEGGPSDMLSLYRCSQISFPEERIMREASAFAKDYLAKCIQRNNVPRDLTVNKNLCEEIEHAVDYPWHMNLPRLMARNYMEQFRANYLWMGKTLYRMPNVNDEKYLQLAKLDFNGVQALHRMEIQQITRWYADHSFKQLTFTRHRPVEIYFTAAVVMSEPEYSECRIAYTKAACIAVILDDLYDAHASFEEVKLFTEAVKRRDLSLLHSLPPHMKICYLGLYNTVNELGRQGMEAQGRDVLPYLRSVWEDLLAATAKEAEWAEAKYVPPLKEYLENGKVSVALATLILNSIFFTGEPLPDHLLQQLDFRGNFLHHVCLTGRLMNDARTFTDERDRGELASCVQCYRKEHPESTEEEALSYLYNLNENSLIQLNYEFLKPGMVPTCYRKLLFDTARAAQLFYKNKDGFGMSAEEMEEHIRKFLFEPVV